MEQAEDLISSYPSITSLEECIDTAISFAINNRRAVMHIYNSVSRDIYEEYLWRVCEHVVSLYIDSIMKETDISETDRNAIINFYKCSCVGLILDWQRKGMKDDIPKQFARLLEIKKDYIEEITEKLSK